MRIVVSLFVSLVIFVIGVVYTLSQPKIYKARGMVQVNEDFKPDQGEIYGNVPLPPKEFAFSVLQSTAILEQVPARLSVVERERLIAPYVDEADFSEKDIIECLNLSGMREFNLVRGTNIIEVAYRHPDPDIAAIVVNAHMKELIDYFLKQRIHSEMKKVEDLRLRADEAMRVVEQLELELANLRESARNPSEEQKARMTELHEELVEKQKIFRSINNEMTKEKAIFSFNPGPIRVIEEATIPEKHINPNIRLWIAGSLLAGLLGGVISFCLIGKLRT